ncbi:hypothetical protein A464_4467 [Salmonella bongori N268-08]|uniref:Uncharacterized protein n=1 Tax=Salmonella bongori N268-08 TaxID=1197719 RepID=S5N430_SALBN|nr:hypothetical protein A464_4467 [Salmonella bongori N268-08]
MVDLNALPMLRNVDLITRVSVAISILPDGATLIRSTNDVFP